MAKITINSEGKFYPITGGFSLDSVSSCNMAFNSPDIVGYIPAGKNFSNTEVIFSDAEGTSVAPSGYYSIVGLTRYWDSSSGTFTSSSPCSLIIL